MTSIDSLKAQALAAKARQDESTRRLAVAVLSGDLRGVNRLEADLAGLHLKIKALNIAIAEAEGIERAEAEQRRQLAEVIEAQKQMLRLQMDKSEMYATMAFAMENKATIIEKTRELQAAERARTMATDFDRLYGITCEMRDAKVPFEDGSSVIELCTDPHELRRQAGRFRRLAEEVAGERCGTERRQ